jgi:hypothetical protein
MIMMMTNTLRRFAARRTAIRRATQCFVVTTLGIFVAAFLGLPVLGQTCVNTGGGFTAGPGKDGSPTTSLTGIVNAYYSPTASVTAGGTSITLNAARTLDATLDGAYISS